MSNQNKNSTMEEAREDVEWCDADMCYTHLAVDNGSAAMEHAVGSIIDKRLPLLVLHSSCDSSNSLDCACGDSVSGEGEGLCYREGGRR